MTKVLIIGAGGMLGHKMMQILRGSFDVRGTLRRAYSPEMFSEFFPEEAVFENIDAQSDEAISGIFIRFQPSVVINCVGIIKQLPSAKNAVESITINSLLPHRLAAMCDETGAKLICISTDCVFDGVKGNYLETDKPNADDIYGRSKALGEVVSNPHLTIRTSIIGRELGSSHSLLDWFLSNRGKSIKGFSKAVFSGFPTVVFAKIVADVIKNHKDLSGLYHVSAEPIDKFTLLKLVDKYCASNIAIEEDSDFCIDRSLNSDKFRVETGFVPNDWEEMIKDMAEDSRLFSAYK